LRKVIQVSETRDALLISGLLLGQAVLVVLLMVLLVLVAAVNPIVTLQYFIYPHQFVTKTFLSDLFKTIHGHHNSTELMTYFQMNKTG